MNSRTTIRPGQILGQRLRLLALGLLTALTTESVQAADLRSDYTWKPVTIGGGGYVTGLLVHPNTANLVYARTDVGGVYLWNNSTSTWKQLITSTSIPPSALNAEHSSWGAGAYRHHLYMVESIGIDPSNDNILYVAAGNDISLPLGRMLKSTDRGNTFTVTKLNVPMEGGGLWRSTGERIAVNPANSNVVLFGSRNQGLWRSTNGGIDWIKVNTASVPVGRKIDGKDVGVNGVIFDGGSRVYVSVAGAGIYTSADGGGSWSKIDSGWARDMEVSQGTLVVAFHNSGVKKYSPSDGWVSITPLGDNFIDDIALDPQNKNRLYAANQSGFKRFYRSVNGGSSWTELATNSQAGKANFKSPDIPWVESSNVRDWLSIGELAFDPFNSSRMWFAEGMGVWRSDNIADGNNAPLFYNVSRGIEEMVATDVLSAPGGKVNLMTWDRIGFHKTNLDAYPLGQIGLSNDFSTGLTLDYAGKNKNFLVGMVTDHRLCGTSCGDGVFSGRSTSGGSSWSLFGSIKPSTEENTPKDLRFGELVVAATSTANMVWIPRKNKNEIYYSTNGGGTWNLCAQTYGGRNEYYWTSKRHLASDKVVDNKFYLYSWDPGKIMVSVNGGSSWADGGALPTRCYWHQLKAAPDHAGHLWFATGFDRNTTSANQKGLFFSQNGGASFSQIAGVEHCWAIGFGKAASGASYPTIFMFGLTGSGWGLYRSTNQGGSWDKISDYPLGIFDKVTTLNGDPDVFGKVYIGWAGNSFAYGVTSGASTPPPPPPPPPALGSSVRIQAEDYDNTTNFAPFIVVNNSSAAGGKYIVKPEGTGSVNSFPSTGHAKYGFDLSAATSVGIWARVRTPNAQSDSFYMDVTGDTSAAANWGTGVYSSWKWRKWKQVTLPAGEHTLTVAYREDGAELDELYISVDGSIPQ